MKRRIALCIVLGVALLVSVSAQPARMQDADVKLIEARIRERLANSGSWKECPMVVQEVDFGKSLAQFDATKSVPEARFYKAVLPIGLHRTEYIAAAVYKDRAYIMPEEFNKLVVACGMKIDEKNVDTFARLFALLHEAESTPDIALRSQSPIKEAGVLGLWQHKLETWSKLDGVITEWKFCIEGGQFKAVDVNVLATRTGDYRPRKDGPPLSIGHKGHMPIMMVSPPIVPPDDPPPGRTPRPTPNWTPRPTPSLTPSPTPDLPQMLPEAGVYVDTGGGPGVKKEYMVVAVNDQPTGNSVEISVYGFEYQSQVTVRVVSVSDGTILFETNVTINDSTWGSATLIWTPVTWQTDLVWVRAEGTDRGTHQHTVVEAASSDSSDHYGSLVIEETRETTLPSGYTLRIYYSARYEYIREGQDPNWIYMTGDAFADLVQTITRESDEWQVGTWGSYDPMGDDEDGVYEVSFNNGERRVHRGTGAAFTIGGENRRIHIPSVCFDYHRVVPNADEVYNPPLTYPTVEPMLKGIVPHEFFHGIQWEYNQWKNNSSSWYWMIEGQARCVPTIQYPDSELSPDYNTYFKDCARNYLAEGGLNKSLGEISYDYGLYWRFLYEHNRGGSERDKASSLLWPLAAAAYVGFNPAIHGEQAMDMALGALVSHGGQYGSFDDSLRAFARANYYLKLNPWHSMYNPDVYVDPLVEHVASYSGSPVSISGGITPNFGTDFAEVNVYASQSGLVRLSFTGSTFATFCVRVLCIDDGNPVGEVTIPPGQQGNAVVLVGGPVERVAIFVARVDVDVNPAQYTISMAATTTYRTYLPLALKSFGSTRGENVPLPATTPTPGGYPAPAAPPAPTTTPKSYP